MPGSRERTRWKKGPFSLVLFESFAHRKDLDPGKSTVSLHICIKMLRMETKPKCALSGLGNGKGTLIGYQWCSHRCFCSAPADQQCE